MDDHSAKAQLTHRRPSSQPPPSWLAVVGCGKWGANHVATAASMNALCAVVDSDAKAACAAAEKHGARAFSSLTQLIAAKLPSLAGVVIATPPATHAVLSEEVLAAGLSVLVEKPMCYSVADANRLAERARSAPAHCKVMVGHLLHYGRPHALALELIRQGHVGNVKRVKAVRFNFGTVRTVENVLWSLCPHDISVALAMCTAPDETESVEAPVRVRCSGHNMVDGNDGIEDAVEMIAEFRNGSQVHIEANWLHPEKERRMSVYGDEGFIVVNEAVNDKSVPPVQLYAYCRSVSRGISPSRVVISKQEQDAEDALCANLIREERVLPLEDCPPLRTELERFRACCFDPTKQPLTDAQEGLRVVQVLAAATESMRENDGNWTYLNACSPSGQVSSPSAVPAPTIAPASKGAPLFFAHSTSLVDAGAKVGKNSKIWHFCHVMPGAVLGERCSLGQNVYVSGKARLGCNVRVQNNVSIYDGVDIGDNAFLGPSCVFTNVRRPRAEFPTSASDYGETTIGRGVSIGANAVIICDVTIGDYAMIGAGTVVTKDVKMYSLVVGNPGRQVGWVGRDGRSLRRDFGGTWRSESGGDSFELIDGCMRPRR